MLTARPESFPPWCGSLCSASATVIPGRVDVRQEQGQDHQGNLTLFFWRGLREALDRCAARLNSRLHVRCTCPSVLCPQSKECSWVCFVTMRAVATPHIQCSFLQPPCPSARMIELDGRSLIPRQTWVRCRWCMWEDMKHIQGPVSYFMSKMICVAHCACTRYRGHVVSP